MENLSVWLENNIGKTLILFDDKNLRWEGRIEKVFQDFVQIYELRQRCSKVFRISAIKNLELKAI